MKKGSLASSNIDIQFDFGVILNNDGVFNIELYINEEFNLSKLIDDKSIHSWNTYYKIKCQTMENNDLELDRLNVIGIIPHSSKLKLVCHGKMKHTKIKALYTNYEPKLFYLVLEGLKMKFCNVTGEIKIRGGERIEELCHAKQDHTKALLISDKYQYDQVFYKSKDSDNIVVEFSNELNNTLSHKRFCEIKHNYISALRLINGAEVRIRKECTGNWRSVGKVDSEVVITYSFRTVNNERHSWYIPIQHPRYCRNNILNTFFTSSFDELIKWNDRIGLNSIIFYLVNSEQSKSMEEKVFIQMIAFEKLTTLYAEYLGVKEEFVPSNEDYIEIKAELYKSSKSINVNSEMNSTTLKAR